MITCKKTNLAWIIEGQIEAIDGSHGGEGAHVGVEDLSKLLAEYVGRRALITVELNQPIDHKPHLRTMGTMPEWVRMKMTSSHSAFYDPICDLWFRVFRDSDEPEELKRPPR